MSKRCVKCGVELEDSAVFCDECGEKQPMPEAATPQANVKVGAKKRVTAGLLGIFLGGFGVHNFYLGNTGKAIAQLLLGTVGALACGIGPAASSIWGLIEGIFILCDNITTDSEGKKLKK